MSGWLPPGCTDKDIDDAAPQDEEPETEECEVCHKQQPADEVNDEYDLFGNCTWVCLECKQRGYWPPQPEYEPEPE